MKESVKVLHIISSLQRGGLETWLMDIMREKNRRGDHWILDVCLTGKQRGPYEEEFLALGGRIHRLPLDRRNLFKFLNAFHHLVNSYQYNILHCHLYLFTAFVFMTPKSRDIKRVAHIHPVEDIKAKRFGRTFFRLLARQIILQRSDFVVAPSKMSLESFVGSHWEHRASLRVLYNGIDIKRFSRNENENEKKVKERLGIPNNAAIVLNVARYAEHKRHGFLVEVAKEILKFRHDVYFVLIGDGALYYQVVKEVRKQGVEHYFRFIRGAQSIDEYYLEADLFALPSSNEGFGIVIIEAAAAGLPTIAMRIPGVEEAAQGCQCVDLLPRKSSSVEWAKMIIRRLEQKKRKLDYHAFPFTIQNSYDTLTGIYHDVFK